MHVLTGRSKRRNEEIGNGNEEMVGIRIVKCLVALLRLSPNFTCTRDRYACYVGRADDAS